MTRVNTKMNPQRLERQMSFFHYTLTGSYLRINVNTSETMSECELVCIQDLNNTIY